MDRKYRLTSLKIDGHSCDMTAGIMSVRQSLFGRRSWDLVVRLVKIDPRLISTEAVSVVMTTERGVFTGRASRISPVETPTDGGVSSRIDFAGLGGLTRPWGS